MSILDDCICIAQARAIAGRRKTPHICTLAYHEPSDNFVRLCLPFEVGKMPAIRRWSRFSFKAKDCSTDNRAESWEFGGIVGKVEESSCGSQKSIHRKILSHYKYESEINAEKKSIGLLIPTGPLRFSQQAWVSGIDDAEIERQAKIMPDFGVWYPGYRVKVIGKRSENDKLKSFEKSVVAWDFFEAIRRRDIGDPGADPVVAISKYRNPYMITGNLVKKRRAFVVVGFLSAPDGYIEKYATAQQLSLTE